MKPDFLDYLSSQLQKIESQGLFKMEQEIASPQGARVRLASGKTLINLCSNNYLGLGNHPDVIKAAQNSLGQYGFGLSSVRFICGTHQVHRELEKKISEFFETEETILYTSCFDANGGLFETLLSEEDAVISDELNHASIIDGIRLCKAKRFRYANSNMQDCEEKLKAAQKSRFKMIATDGVFSMDGTMARLKEICDLADQYQAKVMVDDCHGIGFLGENGRGSIEVCQVMGRVDLITGTLGKALGGAMGGFTTGRKEMIEMLRQRSRPYLFSNALAPVIAGASLKVLDLIGQGSDLRKCLKDNSRYFREKMEKLGFDLLPGSHPIIPVMLGDAKLSQTFSQRMLEEGIFVIGFFYPVVPMGKARIRTQISAAHTREDLDQALDVFERVGKELGVIA